MAARRGRWGVVTAAADGDRVGNPALWRALAGNDFTMFLMRVDRIGADVDLVLEWASPSVADANGVEPSQMIGRRYVEVAVRGPEDRFTPSLFAAAASGRPSIVEEVSNNPVWVGTFVQIVVPLDPDHVLVTYRAAEGSAIPSGHRAHGLRPWPSPETLFAVQGVLAAATAMDEVMTWVSERVAPLLGVPARLEPAGREAPPLHATADRLVRATVEGHTLVAGPYDVVPDLDHPDFDVLKGVAGLCAAAARRVSAAAELRAVMLPGRPETAPDLQIAARYRPTDQYAEIGGDWYETIPMPSGGLALVIGDVEGHDLIAGSVMSLVRGAVRSSVLEGHPPALVLERVNSFLFSSGIERLVTIAYVQLYPADRIITVALAGHPAPLIVPHDGSPGSVLEVGPGLPLGVQPDGRWHERTLLLQPDADLVLYTDGLIGYPAASDHELTRVLARAVVAASGSVEEVADAVLTTAAGQDDVAVLVARLPPASAPASRRILPVHRVSAAIARVWMADLLAAWCSAAVVPKLGEDAPDVIELLLTELVSNAVRHSDMPIVVDVRLDDGRLRVGVDDSSHRMPDMRLVPLDATAGRGLRLVESLATRWGVALNEHGKTVWFELDLGGVLTGTADEDDLLAAFDLGEPA